MQAPGYAAGNLDNHVAHDSAVVQYGPAAREPSQRYLKRDDVNVAGPPPKRNDSLIDGIVRFVYVICATGALSRSCKRGFEHPIGRHQRIFN